MVQAELVEHVWVVGLEMREINIFLKITGFRA